MGVLRSTESFEAEVEEFREMLLSQQQQQQKQKGIIDTRSSPSSTRGRGKDEVIMDENINDEGIVCVTSGVSFLGFAIVNRLLSRGYTVRLLLDTQEDMDKVREMEPLMFGASASASASVEMIVVGDMMDIVDGLCEAFRGCCCVFHTSAFADPSGVSGYSKHMAEIEARTAEQVIEACVRTDSVRKCVFTSSLLACIWRRNSPHHNTNRLPVIVDENCWSDESLCRERKLWYALGKTMAEKAAWRAARGSDVKLVTLCPGLVTGPGFRRRSPTASIAYLKGGQEMLNEGLLATVDVSKLAEAHVGVYEAMGRTACGRYVCFDHVVRRAEDFAVLERQLGISNRSATHVISDQRPDRSNWFELSKRKLNRLMSSSRRRRMCIPNHHIMH